jgi:hypothetical protein
LINHRVANSPANTTVDQNVRFPPIADTTSGWHVSQMAVVRASALWRAIKYLPAVPFIILLGYHAIWVERYPSQIRVTQRSCSDPANDRKLTFRQQTYCVTAAEARSWDTMWLTEYALMAAFGGCWAISALARHSKPGIR